MRKRTIYTVLVMAAVLTLIGSVKFFEVRAAIARFSSFQPPPEAVTTTTAKSEVWPQTLRAIGSVVAVQGVTVSADLPGMVAKIAFDSGARVGKGDLLVALDTSQERAQLGSAESELRLAELEIGRLRSLRAKGVVSQAELDRAEAAHQQATAKVAEIRATIDRKTIRAPFAGRLGIRQVDLGQYLDAGDPVVPLQTLDPIYVRFAVPQEEVAKLGIGAELRVRGDGLGGRELVGRVSAVDSVVDVATRNVEVQATLANPKGVLRPGMFVTAELVTGAGRRQVSLPASAIDYAPYGDSVFLVESMKDKSGHDYRGVRQRFVKLGASRGDQVAVLSGVEPGAEVVTSGVFKLRPGAAVAVDNSVQPSDAPAPKPENG